MSFGTAAEYEEDATLAGGMLEIKAEISSIAQSILRIQDAVKNINLLNAAPTSADGKKWMSLGEKAQHMYRMRRTRSKFFDDDLFGETAWDILLDLFIAAEKNKQVSITSACIGSNSPPTTALRWMAILEQKGLVEREFDFEDRRRAFVKLSDRAHDIMTNYLYS